MVVELDKFMKALLGMTVLLFLACSNTAESVDVSAPAAYRLSLFKFETDKDALEKKLAQCEKNRDIIDLSLLAPLNLTKEQLKIALFVLNDRAERFCEGSLRERFFYSAATHRQVAKSYKLDAGEALEYTEDLLLLGANKKLEFEANYLLLDQKSRSRLEGIRELKVPFLLLETIDQL